jgi:hypothetical protein
MAGPPRLTAAALEHLAGRPVHVRASRRHGCCGGAALVPVAEPGSADAPEGVDRFEVSGTTVYVDRRLGGPTGSWVIDADGFARWRRLVVLGAELAAT